MDAPFRVQRHPSFPRGSILPADWSRNTPVMVPLLFALLAADTLPRPTAPPAASVIVHRQPALPVVALRLSLLADDPPGYAGVGHLIQHLMQPRLEQEVERVGGHAQMERNADALIYTISGPASELGYLAGVLRSALELPRFSDTELLVAKHALAEERLAEWETASGHVRATLRATLFPDDLPAAGTDAAAERWEMAALPAAWAAMYRSERVSVVAVGDVSPAAVEAAFSSLPHPPAAPPLAVSADTVPLTPLAPAEATRGWLGIGYAASSADPATLTITARLLQNQLARQLPTATVEVEHWWTHHGQALTLVVAAPENALAGARRALSGAIGTLRRELDARRVRDASASVRRDLLFFSRTPTNMASLLGSFADRSGDANAAQAFYVALDKVRPEDVEALLTELATRTPARADLPPQKLSK